MSMRQWPGSEARQDCILLSHTHFRKNTESNEKHATVQGM